MEFRVSKPPSDTLCTSILRLTSAYTFAIVRRRIIAKASKLLSKFHVCISQGQRHSLRCFELLSPLLGDHRPVSESVTTPYCIHDVKIVVVNFNAPTSSYDNLK